jgi:exonuclease SbcC
VRPVHLELTAFGPYERTQVIDFAALGGSDLFLIHGPTGAGKTSIFDAITYALFGKLAGTREADRIRADRAAPDLQTRVVFRFRMGEGAYRVERTPEWERVARRGGGTTTDAATASLWRDGEPLPIATGATRVTAKVTSILGMDVGQFTQVALLPQGDFKNLLCATDVEREKLLKKLFGTDRYVDVEELLVERKKRLETAGGKLGERQAELLAGQAPEDIAGRLAATRAQALAAAERAVQLRDADAAVLKLLSDARALATRFDDQDAARSADAQARAGAATVGADRERLERATAAEGVREKLAQAQRAAEDSDARTRETKEGAAAAEGARALLERAALDAAAAVAEAPDRARLAGRAQELDRALPELERLGKLEASLATEATRAKQAATGAEQAATALSVAEKRPIALEAEAEGLKPLAAEAARRAEAVGGIEAVLKVAEARDGLAAEVERKVKSVDEGARLAAGAREAAAAAARKADELHAAREGRLAAWLARTALHGGEPCPVCGSTSHPAPASAEGHIPDEKEVDLARATAATLERKAAASESARASESALLGELGERLARAAAEETRAVPALREELARATQARDEASRAALRIAELEKQVVAARAEVTACRGRRDEADGALTREREATARAEAARDELRGRLEALGVGPGAGEELRKLRDDLKAREARAEAARTAHQSAASRLAEAGAHLSSAERARDLAARGAREARARADEGCSAAGFAGIAECEGALLAEAARKALAASIQQRESTAFAARKRLAELDAALAGATRPDVGAAQAARTAAEAAARQAGDERVRLERDAERLVELTGRLDEIRAELDGISAQLSVAGQVAEMVRGHNPRSMSLHRFVLAARLEEVAEAASERLLLMSGGRFRLLHDTSVTRKNSAAGLSLVVEDTFTGTRDRPVGALSGGESFLASLSLALGLSDVVLRHSGGRRLDSLFVDEGFGTLDEATLDVAIRALETLQQSGRLVGVISHVAELRRRIPAGIEVKSTPAGAVATVRGAT